ncbi:hypothetical protein GN244_ATG17747 [Phytophthora infestans]|uniref:Uncharacterized protein n=1 Tax=Phytophthora infestans TaxID=4787 RepID=A0A833SIS8_PHYIN|nr:hypothetical protein GN244_ATG17747 [Phytophthora infestans]
MVDNNAFVDLMREKFGDIHATTNCLYASNACTYAHNAHWQFWITGTLPTLAQVRTQMSWCTLLGLPNDTSTLSAPYSRARQKIEAMGLQKTERTLKNSGELGSVKFQKLLDTGAPYVVQRVAVQGVAAFTETNRELAPRREFPNTGTSLEQLKGDVVLSHCDFAASDIAGLCEAVAKTTTTRLVLDLNNWDTSSQYVRHAGSALS